MIAGVCSRNRVTSASMAPGVVSLAQRSPVGVTATTKEALLTSMPTLLRSIGRLLGVALPSLMRVRALGPINCPGSTTRNAEERPRCEPV